MFVKSNQKKYINVRVENSYCKTDSKIITVQVINDKAVIFSDIR